MTDPYFSPLTSASINWQNQQPISNAYDDVYFSKDNGLAETEYVFIQGNQLEQRWAQLNGQDFCIGETGFGTGLNFLVTLKLWIDQTSSGTLHYISAEQYPLSVEDLIQALNHWHTLEPLSRQLIATYPLPLPGMHRLQLAGFRCQLTLLYGDASTMFQTLENHHHTKVDAWFLDGFAPAKNPEMWQPALFRALAKHSHKETTLSTFTAAAMVKTGLEEAGFRIEKTSGFGRKRHMLTGKFQGNDQTTGRLESITPSWATPKISKIISPVARHAIIIGSGIAGCTTASALARRGIRTTLIDQHPEPCKEASGNPQAIIYPKLSLRMGHLSRFALAALSYSLNYYREFWDQTLQNDRHLDAFGKRSGLVLLAENKRQFDEFDQITKLYPDELVQLLSKEALNNLSGLRLDAEKALHFPKMGWINPRAICQHLINHPLIHYLQATINTLSYSEGTWQLFDARSQLIATADTVVIACGFGSMGFQQTAHLPLKPVSGQVTIIPETPKSGGLKTILCGQGYLAPAHQGSHSLGASYRLNSTDTSVTEHDHVSNIELLAKTDNQLGNLFETSNLSRLNGRTAVRCTTPDYLPIAGLAPICKDFIQDFAQLRHNGRSLISSPGSYYPNLYLNCGHGSRGMSYAPLCAEIIASQIHQEFAPIESDLLTAIHPGRFIIRHLKRGLL